MVVTGQDRTIPTLVGLISLCGIASRNGILLLDHYLHLVKYEGETWSKQMIIRAGQERVAPVMMTALTAALGLVPLALAAGQPGKELLYPIATVVIAGLFTSTLLEFFVRPALFWTFGRQAAEKVVSQTRSDSAALSEADETENGDLSVTQSHES
jgi:Cu/Ag efflux pump CusA